MPVIRTEALHKVFGEIRALDGLDLSVERKTVFGFLGPNGAGKTTTMRILAGLAKPTSGRAWVAGVEAGADQAEIARCIGYLPEDPRFYPWMTPRELLDYIGRIFFLSPNDRQARTEYLLDLVGLDKAAMRRIGGFSHGMRQRLGLAQALINEPEVLLLDEPVSALDPVGRREMLELIDHLREKSTIMMSTHILADVERVCDTVGIINHGRMLAEAEQEELVERYAVPAFEFTVEHESEARLHGWADGARKEKWVSAVVIDGLQARVIVSDLSSAKRELLRSVVQSRLSITRYEMARPSLEDVFMRLIGHEAAEQELGMPA